MAYDFRHHSHDALREEPTSHLVSEFFGETKHLLADARRLLRAELETAEMELRREAKKVGPAAAITGGGGVLIHAAVLMFAVALGGALWLAMPFWAAFAISGVLFAAGGAALVFLGQKKLSSIAVKPAVTIQHLAEDQRWVKALTQNVRSNLQHDT